MPVLHISPICDCAQPADVRGLDKHLVDMKVSTALHETGSIPKDEPGDGQATEQLLMLLRLHFSYVTETGQDYVNEKEKAPTGVLVRRTGPAMTLQESPHS